MAPDDRSSDTVRPANAARSLYHALNSLLCLLVAEVVLPTEALFPVTLGIALVMWVGEGARRWSPAVNQQVSRRLAMLLHDSEARRVVSGTWYISALAVLAAYGDLELIAVALAVVGAGDPAAGFVGRRWGRTEIRKRRTVEGTVAYVVAGGGAAVVALQIWHPDAPVTLALAGAIAGSLAELFSGRRLDDNLTSPLAAAAGALAMRSWLG
jgi:dolichol kinase